MRLSNILLTFKFLGTKISQLFSCSWAYPITAKPKVILVTAARVCLSALQRSNSARYPSNIIDGTIVSCADLENLNLTYYQLTSKYLNLILVNTERSMGLKSDGISPKTDQ